MTKGRSKALAKCAMPQLPEAARTACEAPRGFCRGDRRTHPRQPAGKAGSPGLASCSSSRAAAATRAPAPPRAAPRRRFLAVKWVVAERGEKPPWRVLTPETLWQELPQALRSQGPAVEGQRDTRAGWPRPAVPWPTTAGARRRAKSPGGAGDSLLQATMRAAATSKKPVH